LSISASPFFWRGGRSRVLAARPGLAYYGRHQRQRLGAIGQNQGAPTGYAVGARGETVMIMDEPKRVGLHPRIWVPLLIALVLLILYVFS
jgi:hypothetical protein